MENIGLEAVLKDKNFQDGVKRYNDGVAEMVTLTTKSGETISAKWDSVANRFRDAQGRFVSNATLSAESLKLVEKQTAATGKELEKSSDSSNRASGSFGILGNAVKSLSDHFVITAGDIVNATKAIAKAVEDVALKGIRTTLEWSENMDKLGDQFGMTGEQATTWTVAMQHVGLSVDEGTQGLNFFTRGLAETTKIAKDGTKTLTPFGESLKKLGISAYDSKGKLKSFDTIMPEIMNAFSKLPAGVNASALAMDLFGARGGTKFLDFLRQGSKGLKDAEAFAKEFGLTMSTDTVNAAEEFGFAMNDLNLALKGVWNQIGIAVLPILRELIDYVIANVLPPLTTWAKDVMPKVSQALQIAADTFGLFIKDLQAGNWGTALNTLVTNLLMLVGVPDDIANPIGDLAAAFAELAKQMSGKVAEALGAFKGWWDINGPAIVTAIGDLLTKAKELVNYLSVEAPPLLQIFFDKLGVLKSSGDEWNMVLGGMLQDAKNFLTGVSGDASTELPKLSDIIGFVMDSMKNRMQGGTTILRGVWLAWQGLTELDLQKFSDGVMGIWRGIFSTMAAQVGLDFPAIEAQFRGWMQNIINDIVNIDWFGIGRQIIQSLADGISSQMLNLRNTITSGLSGLNFNLSFEPRAMGGPVLAGQPYLVGENGPEPFIPATNGVILPHQSMSTIYNSSSRGGPTININAPVYGVNDLQNTIWRAIDRYDRR